MTKEDTSGLRIMERKRGLKQSLFFLYIKA